MAKDKIEEEGEAIIQSGNVSALQDFVASHPEVTTPLLVAATHPIPNQQPIVTFLLEAGADPNAKVSGRDSALHNAATFNDIALAQQLIKAGADVNITGGFHYHSGTPLAYAAGFGYPQMTQLLLEQGATVYNAMIASATGPLNVVQSYFLSDGNLRADADAGGPGTEGPADAAARIEARKDEPHRFIEWWFHIACLHNQLEIANYFLQYDFDPGKVIRVEYQGKLWAHIEPQHQTRELLGTILRHALLRGYDELADLLRTHGVEDRAE